MRTLSMGLTELTATLALLALVVALGVIAHRALGSRARHRERRPIGPQSSYKDLYRHHGWESSKQAERPKVALRHYQYLAASKIDRLYEQVTEAGARPTTTTHQLGSPSIAQLSESSGPASELTTVQKLGSITSVLRPEDVDAYVSTENKSGSTVLVRGSMLMKHAVLPVTWEDENATQAVWLGRLETGRFVCLGGSASNVGADVPRGRYLNSGVAALLQAIETANDQVDVRFQRDVRSLTVDSQEPLHEFPGAWDAEVVDVWLHFGKLHTHRVTFLAHVMTSSHIDIARPRYDVVVGSPLYVEFI